MIWGIDLGKGEEKWVSPDLTVNPGSIWLGRQSLSVGLHCIQSRYYRYSGSITPMELFLVLDDQS